MRNLEIVVLLGMLFFTAGAYAQEEDTAKELGWNGSGEFGFVTTSGNTDSTAMNLKLNFVKTTETWRHRFSGTAFKTSEDGIDDNERYTLEFQSDRKLGEKSYLFGALRWDADKFGSYDPQATAAIGYGRQLMKSKKHGLKGEIGAGYRKLEERKTDVSSSESIIRFLLDDSWQIFESTNWSNRILIESGSDNTFSQFNSNVTVAMNNRFSVKLGFEIRNNSKLPPGDTENTDTISTVNLVSNF